MVCQVLLLLRCWVSRSPTMKGGQLLPQAIEVQILQEAKQSSERFFFGILGSFFLNFLGFLADLDEIRPTGRKYRPRSPFCPGRWAENFFGKICLVPLLLEFWIFNNRLIFQAFYGLSSQNHYSDEHRADLISLFPVSISLLVQILSVLWLFVRRRSEKKSFRAPPRQAWCQPI